MDQPVLIEHRAGEEALSAHQTLVRPLVRVELAHVIVKVRPNGEPPLAALNGALEGLHSLVEAQVLPQVTGLRVRLAAHVAQILATPGQRIALRLLRVVLVVVLAVLGTTAKHLAAHLAAHQQDLVKVRVPRKVVVLLVSVLCE